MTVAPNKQEEEGSKYKVDLPGMEAGQLDEPEEETLAQRIKRIKEEKEKVTAGNFVSDVASQLGLNIEDKSPQPSKTPDAEETLGQRRKRLKEEASKAATTSRPQLSTRRSMADILQANPAGGRQVSRESQQARPGPPNQVNSYPPPNAYNQPFTNGMSMPQLPAHMATLPYYNHNPYANPAGNYSAQMINGGAVAMPGYYNYNGGMLPSMLNDPMMGPPLDPQQRAVIDRWRQGIV
jgi:hypothetical protein